MNIKVTFTRARHCFAHHCRLLTWNTKSELHLTFWHEIGEDNHPREWTYLIVGVCCKPKPNRLSCSFCNGLNFKLYGSHNSIGIKVAEALRSSLTRAQEKELGLSISIIQGDLIIFRRLLINMISGELGLLLSLIAALR